MKSSEEKLIDEKITDIIYRAVQATKQENSGLIADLRKSVALLEAHHKENKEALNRIEAQTIKTNGSVARAFTEIASLKNWQSGIIMAGAVIAFAVIPLCVYVYLNGQSIQDIQISKIQAK